MTIKSPSLSPAEPRQALGLLSSIALSSWRKRAIYSLTKFKMKFPFTQNYLHSLNTVSVIVIVFIFLPVALVAGLTFGLFWLMRWPWWVSASTLLLALLVAIFTGPGVAVFPGLGYMAYVVTGAGNNFKSLASFFITWKLIISSFILGTLAGSILAIWKLRPVIQTAEQKRRKRFFDQSTFNNWLVNWHEKRYLKKEAKKCSKN